MGRAKVVFSERFMGALVQRRQRGTHPLPGVVVRDGLPPGSIFLVEAEFQVELGQLVLTFEGDTLPDETPIPYIPVTHGREEIS